MSCHPKRSARLTVVIHLIDQQLLQVLNVLKNKNWDYQLHTLVKNSTGQFDSDYWLVCWKSGKKVRDSCHQTPKIKGTMTHVFV